MPSATHLMAFRFKAGKSPNPGGMTKTSAAFYREARSLAHQAGPNAIRRLMELAGLEPDGEFKPLQEVDLDPRVMYLAAQSLCDRAYGKPREQDPAEIERSSVPDTSRLSPEERARLRAAAEICRDMAALATDRERQEVQPLEPPPQADRAGGVVIEGSATLAEADGTGE